MRSYRFGPPTFVFLGGLAINYAVVPNPVMESYAFTTTFLFIISAALCYSLIDIETANQESITLVHSGSLIKLYIAKLLYCWLFTIALALFAILYPFLFNMFDRSPSFEEISMSFIFHAASALLGIVLASWFNAKFIQSRLISFLSLSLLIIVTISTLGIEEKLPEALKKVIIFLPPLNKTINVMMNYESATTYMKLIAIGAPVIYILIVTVLFLLIIYKRKLESSQS